MNQGGETLWINSSPCVVFVLSEGKLKPKKKINIQKS